MIYKGIIEKLILTKLIFKQCNKNKFYRDYCLISIRRSVQSTSDGYSIKTSINAERLTFLKTKKIFKFLCFAYSPGKNTNSHKKTGNNRRKTTLHVFCEKNSHQPRGLPAQLLTNGITLHSNDHLITIQFFPILYHDVLLEFLEEEDSKEGGDAG